MASSYNQALESPSPRARVTRSSSNPASSPDCMRRGEDGARPSRNTHCAPFGEAGGSQFSARESDPDGSAGLLRARRQVDLCCEVAVNDVANSIRPEELARESELDPADLVELRHVGLL